MQSLGLFWIIPFEFQNEVLQKNDTAFILLELKELALSFWKN